MSTAVGITIEDQTGVKVTCPPTDTTMAHYSGIRAEEEEFTIQMADETWMAMEGMDMFDVPEWGPQSVRVVWFGSPMPQGLATQEGGVQSLNDLRGAKVCRTPPGTADEIFWEAMFAYMAAHPDFDDLTWDDLGQIPVAGYDEGINAVMSGAADVGIMSCASGEAYEMEASMLGLYWVPIPGTTADDVAAWAAFADILPAFGPSHWDSTIAGLESGGGVADVWASYYSSYCYDFYPEPELAYWFTKQIDVLHPYYKDAFAMLPYWNRDWVFDRMISWFVPWQEGSIRYWQDEGLWTADAQAKQDAMLAKYPQTNTRW
jgi:hypothetical protein